MIGVLLVSHSDYAKGLKKSVEMIAGNNEQFQALAFDEEDSLDSLKAKILLSALQLDTGAGVIIFVDLLGATPFNASVVCAKQLEYEKHDIRVLSGMNLPMVLETLGQRIQPNIELDTLYPAILKIGTSGIQEARQYISENSSC
ncbi:MAG: PTS sugar transporter subunit IIA [Lacticaseibacillus paracasei]